MKKRLEMPDFSNIKTSLSSSSVCVNDVWVRLAITTFVSWEGSWSSLCIISVRALSCGHCRGCLHLLESPLSAGGWLHRSPRALKGEVFLFSHSPVPFLEQQLPAVLLLLSSISFACSGTRLWPLTKKRNKWKKEKKKDNKTAFFPSFGSST